VCAARAERLWDVRARADQERTRDGDESRDDTQSHSQTGHSNCLITLVVACSLERSQSDTPTVPYTLARRVCVRLSEV
jgi:hypothetical protein